VSVPIRAIAGVDVVPLCVGHAVVEEALGTAEASRGLDALPRKVCRGVRAHAHAVVVEGESLSAMHARLKSGIVFQSGFRFVERRKQRFAAAIVMPSFPVARTAETAVNFIFKNLETQNLQKAGLFYAIIFYCYDTSTCQRLHVTLNAFCLSISMNAFCLSISICLHLLNIRAMRFTLTIDSFEFEPKFMPINGLHIERSNFLAAKLVRSTVCIRV